MVRLKLLAIVAFALLAASCERQPDEVRAKTAALRPSVSARSDKAHAEIDMAGAPPNEAGTPVRPSKQGDSP